MFNHMSKITAKTGETLKRGDKIGEIGSTGRVTGPHLHWSLSLNQARVDPMLFLPEKKK
jgi:murein DD-endopeptidase MepM/ murein hydrolase activator NlpD